MKTVTTIYRYFASRAWGDFRFYRVFEESAAALAKILHYITMVRANGSREKGKADRRNENTIDPISRGSVLPRVKINMPHIHIRLPGQRSVINSLLSGRFLNAEMNI